MKNEEAKFILGAYRPNGSDAADDQLKEALAQAQADPELRSWFTQKQAFDSAVAGKLAEIVPPPGLREAILAGSRVSGIQRRQWWRSTRLSLVAAAAVLVASAIALWPNRSVADPLSQFALDDVARGRHEGHGEGVSELQSLLGSQATHLGEGLAIDLGRLRSTGCRTVSVSGSEIFEVCFKRDGSWFHLYVSKDKFSPRGNGLAPTIEAKDKLVCAAWKDKITGYHYAVVGNRAAAVQRLL
jgi:hypothetical protein